MLVIAFWLNNGSETHDLLCPFVEVVNQDYCVQISENGVPAGNKHRAYIVYHHRERQFKKFSATYISRTNNSRNSIKYNYYNTLPTVYVHFTDSTIYIQFIHVIFVILANLCNTTVFIHKRMTSVIFMILTLLSGCELSAATDHCTGPQDIKAKHFLASVCGVFFGFFVCCCLFFVVFCFFVFTLD